MMNLLQSHLLKNKIKFFLILSVVSIINYSECFMQTGPNQSDIQLPHLVGINDPRVAQMIEHLKNNSSEKDLKKKSADFRNSLLIYGPSGNGKTALVRDIAKASGCELIFKFGPSIVGSYAGQGVENISLLFNRAEEAFEKTGKPVMLVIDEIDIFATNVSSEATDEYRRALEELVRKVDEYKDDSRVVIVCTTIAKDKLKQTLVDKFDGNLMEIKNPDAAMREKILRHYADFFKISLSDNAVKELVADSDNLSIRALEGFIKTASRSQKVKKQILSDAELLAIFKNN
jgi:SpoVK/Ycf46/Vps4 family AAA+-type ATPase